MYPGAHLCTCVSTHASIRIQNLYASVPSKESSCEDMHILLVCHSISYAVGADLKKMPPPRKHIRRG